MMYNRPQNKQKIMIPTITRFHRWATFLGLIIVMMSVNLVTFVQGIQVKNNVNTTSREIITWATTDLLSFNGIYLWYKINHTEIDYPVSIVDAQVSFQNPWTLILRVTEKEILGGVAFEKDYVYFDQEGQILLITDVLQEGVRMLEAIEVTDATLYAPLVTTNQEGFTNIIQILQLAQRYDLDFDRIIPQVDASIALIIGETTILLGDNNYDVKVPHIDPILERLEEKAGTLYLEKFDGDNGTITFK